MLFEIGDSFIRLGLGGLTKDCDRKVSRFEAIKLRIQRGRSMKYEYTGRHLEVTSALKSHVENQFEKIKHLFPESGTANAHVIIEVDAGAHRAEIIIKWRDHVLTATSKVADMYQSISQTITKLEKQALRLKSKVIDKHQKKARKGNGMVQGKEFETVTGPESPKIIDMKVLSKKPMTVEEAIILLNDSDDQFYVFRDSESQKFSVVFNRKDKDYGLIQP